MRFSWRLDALRGVLSCLVLAATTTQMGRWQTPSGGLYYSNSLSPTLYIELTFTITLTLTLSSLAPLIFSRIHVHAFVWPLRFIRTLPDPSAPLPVLKHTSTSCRAAFVVIRFKSRFTLYSCSQEFCLALLKYRLLQFYHRSAKVSCGTALPCNHTLVQWVKIHLLQRSSQHWPYEHEWMFLIICSFWDSSPIFSDQYPRFGNEL